MNGLTAESYLSESAQFAGASGAKPTSKQAYRFLNQARKLLWDMGDWEGTMMTGQLQLTESCFYLPFPGGVVKNAYRGCDGSPIPVYEGAVLWSSLTELSSCCESSCKYPFNRTGIYSPIPGRYPSGSQFGFIAECESDAGKDITVRYTHSKGVSTEVITLKDGWKVSWQKSGAPVKIDSIQKPYTDGNVTMVHGYTGDDFQYCGQIHILKSEEKFPRYPQYAVNCCTSESCMVVRVKKIPVDINSGSQLIDLNPEALDWAMKAITAKEDDDHTKYAQNVAFARQRLNIEKESFTNGISASINVPFTSRMIASSPEDNYNV